MTPNLSTPHTGDMPTTKIATGHDVVSCNVEGRHVLSTRHTPARCPENADLEALIAAGDDVAVLQYFGDPGDGDLADYL